MHNSEAKLLFQIQAELIDTKVDLAVNQAINQVVTQIIDLKQEMHREIGGLRREMHDMKHEISDRFSKVEVRLASVETTLGIRNQLRTELRTRFFDYAFKAGWLVLGSVLTYVLIHSHTLFQ